MSSVKLSFVASVFIIAVSVSEFSDPLLGLPIILAIKIVQRKQKRGTVM